MGHPVSEDHSPLVEAASPSSISFPFPQEKVNQLNAKAEAQAALAAREENLSAKERRKMAKLNKSNLRLVCGACGGKGHMKTNKACPKYVGDPVLEGLEGLAGQQLQQPIKVAMTEQGRIR